MLKLNNLKISAEEIIQDEKFRKLLKEKNYLHLTYDGFKKCTRFDNKVIFFRLNDIPVTEIMFKKLYDQNSTWFAMNCEVIHDKVIPVPLGVTDTSWCDIIGDLDVIIETNKLERNIKNLCYFNCNTKRRDAGLKDRLMIQKGFSKRDWVTFGTFERTKSGHKRFIEDIYNHKFVFCPRGNGVDTHRLWMALYLGTIPIVKDHITYRTFKHLPIVFVNDWREVNEEFLNKKYEEIHSKEYDLSILKMSYWEKILKGL